VATIYQTQGTDVTWKASGGTHVLTLTSLANNAGRKGDLHDFGANFPRIARFNLITKFSAAPTAGKTLDVYWATSGDNTNFSGALAAGDATQNDLYVINQLRYVGSMPLLAVTTAQIVSWAFALYSRYGFPVVMNNGAGQPLSGTAIDHALIVTPIIESIA